MNEIKVSQLFPNLFYKVDGKNIDYYEKMGTKTNIILFTTRYNRVNIIADYLKKDKTKYDDLIKKLSNAIKNNVIIINDSTLLE